MKAQVVGNLYGQEGPLVKISDFYVAGFLKAQEVAYKHPDNILGIDIPMEMDVGPKLEESIAEKRGDALAVLQLIRKEDPNILANWETGLSSPSGVGAENDGGAQ